MTEQARGETKLDWPEMYEAGFRVLREEPSIVVDRLAGLLDPERLRGGKALDMGCGELRNSVYLAGRGADVEAVDIVRPGRAMGQLDPDVAERIRFRKMRAQDYPFRPGSFDFVVCTRLIQYMLPEDSMDLMRDLAGAVKSGGGLALNYTVQGGLVSGNDSLTETFSHDPKVVYDTLEQAGLTIDSFDVHDERSSVRLPRFLFPNEKLLVCDLVATKP